MCTSVYLLHLVLCRSWLFNTECVLCYVVLCCSWRSYFLYMDVVAVCCVDKLALRAGNEKDSDETADTVGCCSLRYEHIKLHDEQDGKECVVEFDFLGKDSIR